MIVGRSPRRVSGGHAVPALGLDPQEKKAVGDGGRLQVTLLNISVPSSLPFGDNITAWIANGCGLPRALQPTKAPIR